MHTRTSLLGLATAGAALVAFAAPADKLVFAPAEGSSLTKRFETQFEFSLEDLLLTMNGQEMDPAMMDGFDIDQASGTMSYVIEASDNLVKMGKGKPLELVRLYDTFSGEYEMGTGDSDSSNADQIEGKTFKFTWNEEDGAYDLAPEGDEELSEDDYKFLAEDLDLRMLLPDKDVAEGDTWRVAGKKMIAMLAVGLDVDKASEEINDEMASENVPFDFEELTSGIMDAAVMECTYEGTKELDGETYLVIALKAEIEETLDFSDILIEAIESQAPADADFDLSVTVELAAEATGELLWNAKQGHFHKLTLELEMNLMLTGDGSMDMQGQQMSGGVEAEALIRMKRTATCE
jgi:hypothetical protein